MRLNNVWYYAYWNSRDDIENELAELVRYFPIKSFQELQTEISHFNWSIFDQKLFISDFKKAPLPLTWNIEDLIKDNITASNDRISVIDLDFADEAIYDDILENYHKYNISSLTEQQVWLLLEKFKNQFPNYMEKIINSSLFRSACGNMYLYYWEDFSIMFWIKVYSLNQWEFKKYINQRLSSGYGDYYFTNITLVSKILVKEDNQSDYIKLINNLMWFSDLLCL